MTNIIHALRRSPLTVRAGWRVRVVWVRGAAALTRRGRVVLVRLALVRLAAVVRLAAAVRCVLVRLAAVVRLADGRVVRVGGRLVVVVMRIETSLGP
ncbi:MAG: hypothetical protein R2706_07150 [Acidimicrobiales bacterium]